MLGGVSGAPCAGGSEGSEANVVVGMSQWRTLGKPANVETYRETLARVDAGERREFARYAAALDVTLSRIGTWQGEAAQVEQTTTEVVAKGGALVRSRMAIERGETLSFAVGSGFKTHAEVMYVSAPAKGSAEPCLRLGLRFLDAPLPDSLIPTDAEPLE